MKKLKKKTNYVATVKWIGGLPTQYCKEHKVKYYTGGACPKCQWREVIQKVVQVKNEKN